MLIEFLQPKCATQGTMPNEQNDDKQIDLPEKYIDILFRVVFPFVLLLFKPFKFYSFVIFSRIHACKI